METKYDLEERLLEYAANIIRLVEKPPDSRVGNHVAGQLLRCGTSALPNHGEAQAAESANDFVHKLSICLKELRESLRWWRLIQRGALAEIRAVAGQIVGRNRRTDSHIRLEHTHDPETKGEIEGSGPTFEVGS